jgi:hypothetical protein
MPRALWPLHQEQPNIQIALALATGQFAVRHLLADTGAGTARAGFELVLLEKDCLQTGALLAPAVHLGGAYVGSYLVYVVRVQIPLLGFDQPVRAVAVSTVPTHFDGLAGFRFLNRFSYGNFGDPGQFGLEI